LRPTRLSRISSTTAEGLVEREYVSLPKLDVIDPATIQARLEAVSIAGVRSKAWIDSYFNPLLAIASIKANVTTPDPQPASRTRSPDEVVRRLGAEHGFLGDI